MRLSELTSSFASFCVFATSLKELTVQSLRKMTSMQRYVNATTYPIPLTVQSEHGEGRVKMKSLKNQ